MGGLQGQGQGVRAAVRRLQDQTAGRHWGAELQEEGQGEDELREEEGVEGLQELEGGVEVVVE